MSKHNNGRRGQPSVYIGEEKGLFNSLRRLLGADCSVVVPNNYSGPLGIIGGCGSGKTSGVVLPTLCRTYQGNFFAIDVKEDLSRKYVEVNPDRVVKVLSLRGETEYTYDPFDAIRRDSEDNLVPNMRELANALLPLPANVPDPFWIKSARECLTGALLYYYDMNMSFIDDVSNIMTTPPVELIAKISKSKNPITRSFVNNFIGTDNSDNKLLVGIGQEIINQLSIIVSDPRVRKALSPSDKQIQWTDLKDCSIFLSVPEDRLEHYSPVVTMIITQLIRSLERRPEKHSVESTSQNQTLLMFDEFPRLGKIEAMASAVSTLRSKNVTICLVLQSLAQLDMVYGRNTARIIMDNCSYVAVLGVNDVESQKYFAERAGTHLVTRRNTNTNYVPVREAASPTSPVYQQVTGYTKQESVTREYVIQPHEFATLKDIVLFTPNGHTRVKKSPYHETDTITKIRQGIGKFFGKVKSFFASCFGWVAPIRKFSDWGYLY